MLDLSSHDAFGAPVPRFSYDLSHGRNFLNLVVLGLVLADIGGVRLAGVRKSPGFPTRPHEAGRLITSYLIAATKNTSS